MTVIGRIRGAWNARRSGTLDPEGRTIHRLGLRCAAYRAASGEAPR